MNIKDFYTKNIVSSSNFEITEEHENVKEYSIIIQSKDINKISAASLTQLFNLIGARDRLSLTLTIDDGDSFFLDDIHLSDDFVDQFKMLYSIKENFCKSKIVIYKNTNKNTVSIYDLKLFSNHLFNTDLNDLLLLLYNLKQNKSTIFDILNTEGILFYSDLFCFKSTDILNTNTSESNNISIIKRDSVCTFLSNDSFDFSPNEFYFSGNINDSNLIKLFDCLNVIFSFIFIFDVSKIINNDVLLKLKGYKTSDFKLNFQNLKSENLNNFVSYYPIVNWIYNDGNVIDKIGICRNILSLYLINSSNLYVDNSILGAIESNYSIYLKENVEKYIELKSKVIENLISINQNLNNIADNITENLGKNLLAIITFFVTITVMNSLNDKRVENIFTVDISIISILLIVLSLIFLIITRFEINCKLNKLKTLYSRFKDSYSDILVKKDIDNVFKDDFYFKSDLNEANKKIKFYTIAWIVILLILFIGTILLSRNYLIKLLIRFLIGI
ncbi:hypothetical protein [Clostridium sp.]|uniref:hypothetical protein n=1 Tax=Clostridium sp. TaxID=1506 RepID=UPI003463EC33